MNKDLIEKLDGNIIKHPKKKVGRKYYQRHNLKVRQGHHQKLERKETGTSLTGILIKTEIQTTLMSSIDKISNAITNSTSNCKRSSLIYKRKLNSNVSNESKKVKTTTKTIKPVRVTSIVPPTDERNNDPAFSSIVNSPKPIQIQTEPKN